jgi:hypothetical protein
MLKVQIATAASVVVLGFAAAPWGPTVVAVVVGLAASGMSLTYGAMVVRLSRADGAALQGLLRTALPPVGLVALGLALLGIMAPGLTGAAAVVSGAGVAALAFAAGAFTVRHRLLGAIGSLGHLPAPGGTVPTDHAPALPA